MAAKSSENRQGRTPSDATKGQGRRKTVFKLADGTTVTSGRITVQRRTYTPRARRCKVCQTEFTPQSKKAKYCSDNCRAQAYRDRKTAAKGDQPREVILEALICPQCELGFYAVKGKGAIFCSPTCRAGGYKARRKAAVAALAADLGITAEDARDAVETRGLEEIAAHLTGRGWLYDYVAKSWVLPLNGEYVFAR